LDEGLDRADAEGARSDLQPADHRDHDVDQVSHEHHGRHDDARDELGAEAGLVELLVLLGEGLLGLPLPPEHLHQGVTGEVLLHLRVQRAGVRPLGHEQLLRAFRDHGRDADGERDGDQRDQGEQRRGDEHHHDHTDDGEDRGEHLAERLLQALSHVVHVVRDPAEQFAALHLVEVRQRQPVDLRLDLFAQPVDGALHDRVEHAALQPREDGCRHVEHQHETEHHGEGVEVDALPGGEGDPAQQVGLLPLTARAELVDQLLLRHVGR
jgi:hypothetical protein